MYEFSEVKTDQWMLKSPQKVQVGTFRSMVKLAMMDLGIRSDQLEAAIQEMLKNEHNTAHFGVNRTLIYTYNKSFARKAG